MIEQKQLEASIAKAAADVRANNPLAGSITNTVTIDFVANAQLAVGGSAAMVYLPDEGETLVAAGGAVYLNMGTLFPIYEETIPRTAAAAQAAGKPWVLDPVGIGIGSLRTKLLSELKQHKPVGSRGHGRRSFARPRRRHRRYGGGCTCGGYRAGSLYGRRRCHLRRVRPGHRRAFGRHQPWRQRAYGQGHRLRLFSGRRACRIRYAN